GGGRGIVSEVSSDSERKRPEGRDPVSTAPNSFSEIIGDRSILPTIKHVITLDTDTQLPRDSARKLIGAIAHPLNRPRFDPQRGRICEGYGILQPRVAVSLPSAERS